MPRGAFDSARETRRTAAGRHRLLDTLPPALHGDVERWHTAEPDAPDFGTLSLTAQLEVLRQPAAALRESCLGLNPGLRVPLSPQPAPTKIRSPREWAAALVNAARNPVATAGANFWPGKIHQNFTAAPGGLFRRTDIFDHALP